MSRISSCVVLCCFEIVGTFVACYFASAIVVTAVIAPFQLWAAMHTTGAIVIGFSTWWPPVPGALLLLWLFARNSETGRRSLPEKKSVP